jgi:PAS fold
MASSEILLIAAGSGCLALCGSKCELVAIVCVPLLARFRGRVQAVIAASAFSLVTIAIGHRFSQEFRLGVPYEDTYRILANDGNYHWHLVRALPFRDEQGAIISWYGIHTDINALKEVERELQAREHSYGGLSKRYLRCSGRRRQTESRSTSIEEYVSTAVYRLRISAISAGKNSSMPPTLKKQPRRSIGQFKLANLTVQFIDCAGPMESIGGTTLELNLCVIQKERSSNGTVNR